MVDIVPTAGRTEIIPTVGRIMWFRERPDCVALTAKGEPCAAVVASVIEAPDTPSYLVNVMVLDTNGYPHSRRDVPVLQDPQAVAAAEALPAWWCEWMPYQKAVAARG